MAKLPHQSTVTPVDDQDVSSKAYADASGGGGGASGMPSTLSVELGAAADTGITVTDVSFVVDTYFTVEFWFKPSIMSVECYPVQKGDQGDGSANGGFWFTVAPTEVQFRGTGPSNEAHFRVEYPTVNLDEWVHWAGTRDSVTGGMRIFRNGVELGTEQISNAGVPFKTAQNTTFSLGRQPVFGQKPIQEGKLYDVRCWNVVRTPAEILANYNKALVGDETDLMAYYKFDGDYTDSGPNGFDLAVTTGAATFELDVPFSVDPGAIHSNISGEISALTEKAAPVDADHVLIEDSEDGDVKKRVLMSNMLGGSSGPIAAAQGDYLMAVMALEHSAVVGQPVEYEVAKSQRGELQIDAVNHKITGLKAGRTYHIQAHARSRNDWFAAEIYDITAAEVVGIRAIPVPTDGSFSSTSSVPVTSHTYTPTVDTEIEFRVTAINSAGALVNADGSWISVVEIGAVQADVVGGLEFMDIITVDSPTASVSFGASGDGAFKRALDGDIDHTYILTHRTYKTSTMTTVDLKPDGIGTNQVSKRVTMESSAATFPRLAIAQPDTNGYEHGTTEFDATSGRQRSFHTEASLQSANVPTEGTQYGRTYSGTWNDIATNITSLEIATNDASAGIDIGSEFVLYRRTRTNLRADSAAVYERMSVDMAETGGFFNATRTLGHTIYGGSVVGLSVRVEDAVTAGSITIIVTVDGVGTLIGALDTTNPTSLVVRAPIGQHKFAADKNVAVQFLASNYDNAGSTPSPVTVQVHMTNDALISPPKNTQIEGALWHPPEFAHPDDDEFDSGVIDPSWSIINPSVGTPIDPYAAFADAPRVELDRRQSWLMMQPHSPGGINLNKPYTFPTNLLMWARISFNSRLSTSPVNGDFTIDIRFAASTGGAPDSANRIALYLSETDTGNAWARVLVVEGGGTALDVTTTDLYATNMNPQPFEYIAIHKVGSTYHFWAATNSGSWTHLASHVYAGAAIDRISMTAQNQSTAAPGNMIMGLDFIRFVESATFLP